MKLLSICSQHYGGPNYIVARALGHQRLIYKGKWYSFIVHNTMLPSFNEFGVYIRLDKSCYKAILFFSQKEPERCDYEFIRIGTIGATDGVMSRKIELKLNDIVLL